MKCTITTLLTAVILMFSLIATAQDGSVDATFNPTDSGSFNGVSTGIGAMALQPDGKLIVTAGSEVYLGAFNVIIKRINADESVDLSFNSGVGVNGSIASLVLLPEGKILIAGSFTTYNNIPCGRIARLNSDGSLDTTFNQGGLGANEFINATAVSPDGKIIIAGYFTQYNGLPYITIARLNSDGTADTTFNPGTAAGSGNPLLDVAVQADGKIVTVGNFISFGGFTTKGLVRLNQDGSVDTGFVHNYPGTGLYKVVVQNDGKIVVVGFSGTESEPADQIYRYHANGNQDTSFVLTNNLSINSITELKLQPDNKILLSVNNNSNESNTVIRLNENGSSDTSYAISYINGDVFCIELTPQGSIFLAGSFNAYNGIADNNLMLLNPDGSKDNSFDTGASALTGADGLVYRVVKQNDDKLIIVGDFYTYNGVSRRGIVRLLEDGAIDTGFNPGSGVNGRIEQIKLTQDGKIVIAGNFTSYNNVPVNNMARINADGSLDVSFTAAVFENIYYPQYSISALNVLPDGSILVGGPFLSYGGVPCGKMVKLTNTGALDGTFNSDFFTGSSDKLISEIVVLPNENRILVAGSNSSVALQNTIVKIDYNGIVDASFTPITSQWVRDIQKVSLQADGKILVFGLYLNESETFNTRFMRFNANGTPDIVIYSESIFESPFLDCILAQPDGKILVSGGFGPDFAPLPGIRIIRLNNDGSPDETFDTGTSTYSYIGDMVLQGDKVVIVGSFVNFDGVGRNRIARLFSSGALSINAQLAAPKNNLAVYTQDNVLNIQSSQKVIASISVFDLQGRLVASQNNVKSSFTGIKNISAAAKILIVKVQYADNTSQTKKIYY
ncbi:hypothetical protein [Flavobacterium subsaxonicum]|uniref:Secretion system C-terminal sorting domain-containing protein n=1 Tax=Flavobacterium subsaxonicum WB 4.1-42 = DSM 21790 TaxID=1121898 RepID=A0A0A2MJU5_9FLAO|nr:hypothetical protein [Flavobacterium subsaxonicum]KGO92917.1 hypothetical protein Q766_09790 [Flavobacterium subsaxonicum WB 4.1-42 = DSM 21790]